ncbi:hypothetical protein QJU58_03995 [Pasteurella atlantica]|uniref:hypothetical protein n=1 Tax=Pasteurellaceae TaxID=712 RepID=UPI001B81F8D6|nr:hypothetical protein [Pasteurella atlantica]MBR0573870.1 hypothetical protein [Pasteurella atlantica]MDP8039260.1 hypothetical protein [Pasteurella atlantica]MDP8041352.1 hypothetical protein [Pasteurella atlantica]MDP8045594.1 hypothetical protein [Pasteurella atlantica]MDP8061447.1 hypothetical protein [Pasteurella atlantica]
MIKSKHLSAYTPSNMSPETLEFIFVQRHKLLEKSVGWIEESLLTDKKNHLLFVGARGSGKTHLITMIINRLKVSKNLDDLVVIWLGEDDVIMSLTSFALAIINKMASTYPIRFNNKCLEEAKGKNPDEVANIILEDIKKQAGHTTLLIVKENMSDVFYGLKDLGQKRLRAYLQENNHISLLGTSQKLFDGVSSRNSAFWGFFDIHHLNSLSVKEASQLISNIAKLNQDDELVDFLNSSQGNYRIRALHYLAGGNHRLYIELANFLTKASLDNFVDAITQLADHLTPYFQERIRSLSPQQGAIIQKLCELNGAIQVKVIAEALFIDERAVASQLQTLKGMGYVIVHKRGRAAYYEIAEPLLRLSLEVKNNHGKPLKIIASLFRAWFSDKELLANRDKGNLLLKEYCQTALEQKEILNYLEFSIYSDLNNNKKNYNKVIKYLDELLSYSEIIGKEEHKAIALLGRSVAYLENGNKKQALHDVTQLIKTKNISNEWIIKALQLRSIIYLQQENISLCLSDLDKIENFKDIPLDIKYWLIFLKAKIHYSLLDIKNARNSLKKVFLEMDKESENYFVKNEWILGAISKLGTNYWKKEIEFLLSLYGKYCFLSYLASELIISIRIFINNETMHSSFRKWAELWREASATYPEMQPAIEALNASVEALAVGNDKPLFVLPKEIRELILPMFEDKLN